MTGAYIGAAATLDTVEQAVVLDFVEVFGMRMPIELLRYQFSRADIHASTAADARQWRLRQR